MLPRVPSLKLAVFRNLWVRVALGITLFIGTTLFFLPYEARSLLLHGHPYTACNAEKALAKCHNHDGDAPIPSILHVVYILQDPSKDFPFQFTHFLSVFSANHHLQPEKIYLHTNIPADSDQIARAKNGTTGKWNNLIFNMPNLEINTVEVPTHTKTGRKIELMEHKSDFVRVKAVHDFGGVYLDTDVHTLRNIKELRESGYQAVGGREMLGKLNSGTFMAAKGGKMITQWMNRMHEVYDGGWVKHSNVALTHVAEKLESEPCEMLILGRDAFAPGSWTIRDVEILFDVHDNAPPSRLLLDADTQKREEEETPSWARDWSCSYLLHAWSRSKPRDGVKHNGITPQVVMKRQSNFARAVYPITKIMYDQKIVNDDDTDTGRKQE